MTFKCQIKSIYASLYVDRTSLIVQSVKNLPAMQETQVRFLGQGRSFGEGNGNPLQYSCLGNPTDREAWRAIVHGVSRIQYHLATKQQIKKIKMWYYSCRTLCNPVDRSLCPENSPGRNTGMGCHFLLQGIFPTQGWSLGLLHCRQMLYHLSHQGNPYQCQININWDIIPKVNVQSGETGTFLSSLVECKAILESTRADWNQAV